MHSINFVDSHKHIEAKGRAQNLVHVALTVCACLSTIKYVVYTHVCGLQTLKSCLMTADAAGLRI